MTLVCGILVGGMSRRMGRPKALISVDGVTLLERTVGVARSAGLGVVLLGAPAFELPRSLRGVSAIEDDPPNCGPIGGLAGFFKVRSAVDCLLVACDMPRLEGELLKRLAADVDDEVDAVVPREGADERSIHPCCAVYRSSAAQTVFDAVSAGQFAMRGLLDRLRVAWLPLDESEAASVANANTPVELNALCAATNGRSMPRPAPPLSPLRVGE